MCMSDEAWGKVEATKTENTKSEREGDKCRRERKTWNSLKFERIERQREYRGKKCWAKTERQKEKKTWTLLTFEWINDVNCIHTLCQQSMCMSDLLSFNIQFAMWNKSCHLVKSNAGRMIFLYFSVSTTWAIAWHRQVNVEKRSDVQKYFHSGWTKKYICFLSLFLFWLILQCYVFYPSFHCYAWIEGKRERVQPESNE